MGTPTTPDVSTPCWIRLPRSRRRSLPRPDIISQWLNEADAAFLQYSRCRQDPTRNFLDHAWCATVFVGDMLFANTRLAVDGVLTVVQVKQLIEALKYIVEAGLDLRDLNGDLHKYYGSEQSLTIPAGLLGDDPSMPNPPTNPPVTQPPSAGVSFSLSGSCSTDGGTITSSSGNFTPGSHYTVRAWRPDGTAYPLGSGAGGTVRGDGSIVWRWPCAGDPAGQYTTEVTDEATGRSTGRVAFTVGGGNVPSPPPPPQTWAEQQGSHGANTFTNPYNASGMGVKIEPMAWVEVSCKVYAPQIASANPDGYWYRIASPPWNNQYYAVANTFWNGDIPGQTPYTHNTDFNVPDC